MSEAWQSGGVRVTTGTTALWAQDKISRGNLTLALGLRADEQDLGIAGGPSPRTLAPRLGLSWALGAERSTLLRASLSRFASRLGDRAAFRVAPGAPAALYSFLLDGAVPLFWYADNVDPLQPGRTPNAVAPDLRPEITDEAVLAVEHAFEPAFTVGLQATWRRTRDLLEERLFVRDGVTGDVRLATAADWAPAGTLTGALPGGAPYAASVYDLRPGLAPTGGRLLVNGDRWQDSLGLSLTWEKRLADRWMTRGHLSWEDWTWHLGPEFRRFDDPTNTLGSGDDDGGRVAPAVSADGLPHEPARFLGGRWSFAASGLRQLPGGFDASLTVNGRQGAPLLYFRRFARERAGLANVQLTQLTGRVDAFRTPDLATVDARLAKELVRGDLAVTLAAEAFNLLDARAAVARELDLGVTRAGRVDELVAPRTFRLGLRLQWR